MECGSLRKPEKETVLKKKSSVYDRVAIAINESKWDAAKAFCNKHGFIFEVMTERQLFQR